MTRSRLVVVLAVMTTAALTGSQSLGSQNLDSFAGVYKIDGGPRPGENSRIENILEIVKQDENSLYFRLHAEGSMNGCVCGIWGIAKENGGHFEYNNKGEVACKITFVPSPSKLSISYESDCGCNHCPAGAITEFPATKRKPIKYLDRIKTSRQYLDSVKASEPK